MIKEKKLVGIVMLEQEQFLSMAKLYHLLNIQNEERNENNKFSEHELKC